MISPRARSSVNYSSITSKPITTKPGTRIPDLESMTTKSLGRNSSILLVKTPFSSRKFQTAKRWRKRERHQDQALTKPWYQSKRKQMSTKEWTQMDSSSVKSLSPSCSRPKEVNSGSTRVKHHTPGRHLQWIQALVNMIMRKRRMISRTRLSWMRQYNLLSIAVMIELAIRKSKRQIQGLAPTSILVTHSIARWGLKTQIGTKMREASKKSKESNSVHLVATPTDLQGPGSTQDLIAKIQVSIQVV